LNETRILLAEDEKDVTDILGFYLSSLFNEVIIAQDGLEAYEYYLKYHKQDKTIDLVLTDLKMPNMEGLELIEKIASLNAQQKVMIISAYANSEELIQFINLQVVGYFMKPLNIDNMMKILKKVSKEVLQQKQLAQEAKEETIINKHYTYNATKKTLYHDKIAIPLSAKEKDILELLLKQKGEIVSQQVFIKIVWQGKQIADTTFRATIKKLKDKIKENDFIISHKGYGYTIN